MHIVWNQYCKACFCNQNGGIEERYTSKYSSPFIFLISCINFYSWSGYSELAGYHILFQFNQTTQHPVKDQF